MVQSCPYIALGDVHSRYHKAAKYFEAVVTGCNVRNRYHEAAGYFEAVAALRPDRHDARHHHQTCLRMLG